MNKKKLAVLAFETYCDSIGDHALEWSDLTQDERNAWVDVGTRIEEEILEGIEEDGIQSRPGSLFDDLDGDDEENEDDDA